MPTQKCCNLLYSYKIAILLAYIKPTLHLHEAYIMFTSHLQTFSPLSNDIKTGTQHILSLMREINSRENLTLTPISSNC